MSKPTMTAELTRWLAVSAGGDAVRLLSVNAPSCGPDVFVKLSDVQQRIAALEAAANKSSATAAEAVATYEALRTVASAASTMVEKLEAENARLRAFNVSLQKYADRYQWLRENGEQMITADRGMGASWTYGEELDNKVDAAIKAK